ncbi:MAG: helix-turn-helix domain-containing protein [Thermonemataceae bacterium]
MSNKDWQAIIARVETYKNEVKRTGTQKFTCKIRFGNDLLYCLQIMLDKFNTTMDNIGDKIRKKRISLDYSQAYIAEELGISQNAYSKIESNQTKSFTLDRLYKIAEILETDVAYLLDIERNIIINASGSNYNSTISGAINNIPDRMIDMLKEELENIKEEKSRLIKIIEKLTTTDKE